MASIQDCPIIRVENIVHHYGALIRDVFRLENSIHYVKLIRTKGIDWEQEEMRRARESVS